MTQDPSALHTEWLSLRSKGGLHALEIADALAVSECELLATACGASGDVTATRLSADWPALIAELPRLGQVKTVTRNRDAVIEVEGKYDNVEFFGAMGQSVGTVDLRIFGRQWQHGFAVTEKTRRGISRGLQFFDGSGRAIHKLYLREESDHATYDQLVRTHTSTDVSAFQVVDPPETVPPSKPDSELDVEALRTGWRAMKDTHEFFGLLRRFGGTRTRALRLAGEELAERLENTALTRVLEKARDQKLPIMVFVGNGGVIQIHSGEIRRVAPSGPWINVLDPDFNLHVRTDRIAEAWRVRKPTVDGNVTSVELYAEDGSQIALLVGKRKPGVQENEAWRALVEELPAQAD